MITGSVKVTQNRLLGQLQGALKQHVRDERVRIAHQVEADWKAAAPVDSGQYRDSIHTIDDATKTTSIVTTDLPGDPYDIYQEYGTEDTAAHPSARPSAERNRQGYRASVESAIEDATK